MGASVAKIGEPNFVNFNSQKPSNHPFFNLPLDVVATIMYLLTPFQRMVLHQVSPQTFVQLRRLLPPPVLHCRPLVSKGSQVQREQPPYSCSYTLYPSVIIKQTLPYDYPPFRGEYSFLVSSSKDFKQSFFTKFSLIDTNKLRELDKTDVIKQKKNKKKYKNKNKINKPVQPEAGEVKEEPEVDIRRKRLLLESENIEFFNSHSGTYIGSQAGKPNKFFFIVGNEFGLTRSFGATAGIPLLHSWRSRPCWDDTAIFYDEFNQPIRINKIKVGMTLLTDEGYAVVREVTNAPIDDLNEMVEIDDFRITRGHPIMESGEWYRPDELYPIQKVYVKTLYNILCSPPSALVVGKNRRVCSSLGVYSGRVSEMDPIMDCLYGSGYGTPRALRYRWLLFVEKRIPDHLVEEETDRYWRENDIIPV